jgi:chemotaxis-related protein WspD
VNPAEYDLLLIPDGLAGQRLRAREEVVKPEIETEGDQLSVLIFRLVDEWLALPVTILVEVTRPHTPHKIPHRAGLLSGLVNIRGELHLCIQLDLLLALATTKADDVEDQPRILVVRRDQDTWVFLAHEVDQVHRLPVSTLVLPAPTLSRASSKLSRGVFKVGGRSVGLLDEVKLFQAVQERLR